MLLKTIESTHNNMHSRIATALALSIVLSVTGEAHGFNIVNRWGETQLSGSGLQRGDATMIQWSVVADGQSYDRSDNSNLIQFLDDGWNVPTAERTLDFRNREWWSVISNAYAQYGRVSGITMHYLPEQTASGPTGLFGDIRIGGEDIDGTPGGALADNVFPDGGDMRIDTTLEDDGSVGFYFSTEAGLRNLVIHETGHGVGLGHVEFVNSDAHAVMEGGLRTDIWGLQFDDIYGLNRQYGDPQEQGSGNNSAPTATSLGDLGTSGSVSVGTDADDWRVEQFDGDWLGIDGGSDQDWFRFSVMGESFANLQLTPMGPTYETLQQGLFNAAEQSDLVLQIFSASPSLTLLETIDAEGIGDIEQVGAQFLPEAGDYFLRVRGRQDVNQFYQIDLSISELPLAGTSADLNLDGVTDILDWTILVDNSGTSTQLLTQRDAFMLGDLNFDGENNYEDYKFFKSAYTHSNGAESFAALLQVPEPTGITVALVGLALLPRNRDRKPAQPAVCGCV